MVAYYAIVPPQNAVCKLLVMACGGDTMTTPFSFTLSLALDSLIIAIEALPPWSPRRTALRRTKAQLERAIPRKAVR